MTKVINLFAGPGAGKSTTAAGLFFEMKCRGLKVELVTEYAKELAYEGRLGDSLYNSAWAMQIEQKRRMERLRGKVDFIVTDSPLFKDIFYAHYTVPTTQMADFKFFVAANADSWDNHNVFIERVKPYAAYGRRESEQSARSVCEKIREGTLGMIQQYVPGDHLAPTTILRALRLKETL